MPQALTESGNAGALGDTSTLELGTFHQDQAQRIDRVAYPGTADVTAWREGRIAPVRSMFLSEDRGAHPTWTIARSQRVQARKGEDRRWSGQQAIHYPPLLL